jgi:hypothetical protein
MEELQLVADHLLGLSASDAQELTTPQVVLRAAVVYFVLILFVRMGKKRFLGQATVFDAILINKLAKDKNRPRAQRPSLVALPDGNLGLLLVGAEVRQMIRSRFLNVAGLKILFAITVARQQARLPYCI